MCIRDSDYWVQHDVQLAARDATNPIQLYLSVGQLEEDDTCLLYTSDAADERSSVDLGGRRIIKKKKRADY